MKILRVVGCAFYFVFVFAGIVFLWRAYPATPIGLLWVSFVYGVVCTLVLLFLMKATDPKE